MSDTNITHQALDAFKVKWARRSQKLTRQQVAKALAISEQDYAEAEEGRRPFSDREMKEISNLLGAGLGAFEATCVDDLNEGSFELSKLIESYRKISDPSLRRPVQTHLDGVARWEKAR